MSIDISLPGFGRCRRFIMPVVITTIIMIIVATVIYNALSAFFIKDAEYKIKNVLLSHRGLHSYIQKVMHPAFYAARDAGKVAQDYYSPKIFSSSYIVRNIHSFYNEELKKAGLPEIYYKMASDNPRNPVNRADASETTLIRMFNDNRDITEFRKIIMVGGSKYLYYAIPFLETNSSCIRCHGKRADAPQGLQALYPGEGGFNEKTGVYRAIESIRVPISDEITTATVLACSISAGFVAMFMLFFFNRRLKVIVDEKTSTLEAEVVERKSREADLEIKNAELERFTYTVSHDLKSPLITIKSYTGSIKKDLSSGRFDRIEKDLERVSAAGDKMAVLLDSLLELSRIGQVIHALEAVDMNMLVDDAVKNVAGLLQEKGAKIVVQPELPTVWCDRQRIGEVIQNLLENALKYMGEQSKPHILFGVRREYGTTTFFVQDNGIGVDEKYQQNIFGLFNKLDAGSVGTGIGLALVKRIVEVHGGTVWVESEGLGKGSTFCFRLPDHNLKETQ
ncbi:MAG: DUF3365 domain-containing protein [Desulfuromonadaceae bacterium]|nr:DUF3365 domain-containing protein [Desulfuromonadaceae bacterium]MDD2847828.1 DUF3365 domain-containing protein [Desulfuromonadaceae bacterium]MDD4129627.1 DUF3365 domain-containing protein [Desulfuromonadaceae bacterium]